MSPSVEPLLGFAPDDLIGRKYTDFLDPISSLNSDVDECRASRFQGDEMHQHVRVIRDANQRIRILDVQTYGEEDTSGNVIANHGLAQDITSMFQMEATIKRQLAHLQSSVSQLSDREQQVLDRVLNGRLNKSIAKELEISERAVERIRSRIMKKYAAETTAQLVSKATELRLLSSILRSAEESLLDSSESLESAYARSN